MDWVKGRRPTECSLLCYRATDGIEVLYGYLPAGDWLHCPKQAHRTYTPVRQRTSVGTIPPSWNGRTSHPLASHVWSQD